MSLAEKLRHILQKLKESFEADLPDPDELEHSGEMTIRGHMFTTRSSAPLDNMLEGERFTVYLHSRENQSQGEHVYYFHFEGRREITSVIITLDEVEGAVRQNVTLSTLPREIFVQRVEKRLGRSNNSRRPPRRTRREFVPRREETRQFEESE